MTVHFFYSVSGLALNFEDGARGKEGRRRGKERDRSGGGGRFYLDREKRCGSECDGTTKVVLAVKPPDSRALWVTHLKEGCILVKSEFNAVVFRVETQFRSPQRLIHSSLYRKGGVEELGFPQR